MAAVAKPMTPVKESSAREIKQPTAEAMAKHHKHPAPAAAAAPKEESKPQEQQQQQPAQHKEPSSFQIDVSEMDDSEEGPSDKAEAGAEANGTEAEDSGVSGGACCVSSL